MRDVLRNELPDGYSLGCGDLVGSLRGNVPGFHELANAAAPHCEPFRVSQKTASVVGQDGLQIRHDFGWYYDDVVASGIQQFRFADLQNLRDSCQRRRSNITLLLGILVDIRFADSRQVRQFLKRETLLE